MNENQWGPQPAVAPAMQSSRWGCLLKAFLWSQLVTVAFVCGAVGAAAVADVNGGRPTAGVFGGFVAGFAAPFVVVLVVKAWLVRRRRRPARPPGAPRRSPARQVASADDPAVHARAFTATVGGAFLGLDPQTSYWVGAPAEQAVLVLGPPRSGKTSCVVIPAVASALGPVVSTSTKAEVMAVTGALRSRFGDVWHFDPAGSERTPPGARRLCWSPVPAASTWDRALLVARAMVTAAPAAAGASSESLSGVRGVGRKKERHRAQLVATGTQNTVDQLTERIEGYGREREPLADHQEWLVDTADDRQRRDELGGHIDGLAWDEAAELEANPPEWITQVIGEPADTEEGRARWLGAAGDIVSYRTHYDFEEPFETLGPRPDLRDTTRRNEYEHVDLVIRATQRDLARIEPDHAHQLGRSIEADHGLDIGL